MTSQLSSTFPSIGMSGFTWGDGDSALLLGTNVIGAVVAWGVMLITLLENPFGSALTMVRSPSFLRTIKIGSTFLIALSRQLKRDGCLQLDSSSHALSLVCMDAAILACACPCWPRRELSSKSSCLQEQYSAIH